MGYNYAPSSGIAVGYSTGDCVASTGTLVITSLSATQITGTAKKVSTCDATKTLTEGSFKGVFQ